MSIKTATYGLTHIAVAVQDLDKTKTFYQSIFDMEVMYHRDDFLQLTTPGCHDILYSRRKRMLLEIPEALLTLASASVVLKILFYSKNEFVMQELSSKRKVNLFQAPLTFFSKILMVMRLKFGMKRSPYSYLK
jgi:hypothetical protein